MGDLNDDEQLYLYWERRNILEYEGGMSPEEAERRARIEVYGETQSALFE